MISLRRIEQQIGEESRLEKHLKDLEERKKYCENAQDRI
jgi:hypothetical protein